MLEGDADAEVGSVDNELTVTVTETQVVVLQVPSALT
jgi:hypothetical protein